MNAAVAIVAVMIKNGYVAAIFDNPLDQQFKTVPLSLTRLPRFPVTPAKSAISL